jgi:hypothetical protein
VATIDPDMLWEYINKATDWVYSYAWAPICPISEVEIEQVVSNEDTNNNIEGTASQPLHATCCRKKQPSSGEISPSCCADCDKMLTGKADSISCDGPGCDQWVCVISLGWIHL